MDEVPEYRVGRVAGECAQVGVVAQRERWQALACGIGPLAELAAVAVRRGLADASLHVRTAGAGARARTAIRAVLHPRRRAAGRCRGTRAACRRKGTRTGFGAGAACSSRGNKATVRVVRARGDDTPATYRTRSGAIAGRRRASARGTSDRAGASADAAGRGRPPLPVVTACLDVGRVGAL